MEFTNQFFVHFINVNGAVAWLQYPQLNRNFHGRIIPELEHDS